MQIPTHANINPESWKVTILGYANYSDPMDSLYFEDFGWEGTFYATNISWYDNSLGREEFLDAMVAAARGLCAYYAEVTERPDVFLSEDRIQLRLIGDGSITTFLPGEAPEDPEMFVPENFGER